jgi:hypothetical protein
MTSRLSQGGSDPLQRAIHSLFALGAEQLHRQAKAFIRRGVDIVVIEPTARDQAAMGVNLMDSRRWGSVLEVALSSVSGQLRRRHVRSRLGAFGTAA